MRSKPWRSKKTEKRFPSPIPKNSGITVTITESVNGKKKTTKVRAADTAELAKKDPEAHKFYRKYFHPRPKNGKPK